MVGMGTLLMAMEEGIMVEGTDLDIILDIGHQTTDHPIDLDLHILPQDQDDQQLYLQIDHLPDDLQPCHHDL